MNKSRYARNGKIVRRSIDFSLNVTNGDVFKCDNVILRRGVLSSQYGIEVFNDKAYFTRFYEDYGQGLIASTGDNLARIDNFGAVTKYSYRSPVEPFTCVKYRDRIFGTTANTGTLMFNKGNSYPYWTMRMDSLAATDERIFGVYDSILYFSNASENFSDSAMQTIKLPTRCTALAVIGNTLYILGRTCYKLVPSADNVEIKLTKIYDGLDDVLRDTVAVVGNKIVFATVNGMFCLSNSKVKRIDSGLEGQVDLTAMRAYALDNCYIVLCTPNRAPATPCAVMFDADTFSVIGVLNGVTDVIKFRGKTLFTRMDGIIYCLSSKTYADCVKYVKTDVNMDTCAVKYLRKLVIKTENPIEIYITADKTTRLYKIEGKKCVQTLPVAGNGTRFDITIKANGKTSVEKLELVAETFGEE